MKLIRKIANLFGRDIVLLKGVGGRFGWDYDYTGEDFVVEKVLKKFCGNMGSVLFDVGAHVGKYARKLRNEYPEADIYSFEPSSVTFEHLKDNISGSNIKYYNIGFGAFSSNLKMYDYSDKRGSEHASVYRNVLTKIHNASNIDEFEVEISTIDEFCEGSKISSIDFLKIDVEGYEIEVLKGARKMLSHNQIKIIQFEFNEMNVYSRVFLRDFYELLAESYNIYRVGSSMLIPVFRYCPQNEIFEYSHFLAVNKNLVINNKKLLFCKSNT